MAKLNDFDTLKVIDTLDNIISLAKGLGQIVASYPVTEADSITLDGLYSLLYLAINHIEDELKRLSNGLKK